MSSVLLKIVAVKLTRTGAKKRIIKERWVLLKSNGVKTGRVLGSRGFKKIKKNLKTCPCRFPRKRLVLNRCC